MTEPSKTTRIDAAVIAGEHEERGLEEYVPAALARGLELSISDVTRERDEWKEMEEQRTRELQQACAELRAQRSYAVSLEKALRGLGAMIDTIHDRHCDEADCDEDADGHRTPNRDMHTMVDCNVARGGINLALAKNPNPAGHLITSPSHEGVGPVGLGPAFDEISTVPKPADYDRAIDKALEGRKPLP